MAQAPRVLYLLRSPRQLLGSTLDIVQWRSMRRVGVSGLTVTINSSVGDQYLIGITILVRLTPIAYNSRRLNCFVGMSLDLKRISTSSKTITAYSVLLTMIMRSCFNSRTCQGSRSMRYLGDQPRMPALAHDVTHQCTGSSEGGGARVLVLNE